MDYIIKTGHQRVIYINLVFILVSFLMSLSVRDKRYFSRAGWSENVAHLPFGVHGHLAVDIINLNYVCVFVEGYVQVPVEASRGSKITAAAVRGAVLSLLTWGCWELNSGLIQEQYTLWCAEQSLPASLRVLHISLVKMFLSKIFVYWSKEKISKFNTWSFPTKSVFKYIHNLIVNIMCNLGKKIWKVLF